MNKTITEIICKGRLPIGQPCEAVVAETDGQFYYFEPLVGHQKCKLDLRQPSVVCADCGYVTDLRVNRRKTDEQI